MARFPSPFACLLYILLAVSAVTAKWIVPGARWYDTEGNIINAHAGGIVLDNGKFWWFGEYKPEGHPEGAGVSVYSSEDLRTWEFKGLALKPIEGHPYISPSNIIQRPKVIYSEESKQYHMLWHADNSTYGLLLQGLATSPNISGPYTFESATAPLGNWSQDFGVFTDYKDGRSYALYSNGDRKEARDCYITQYNTNVSALEKVVFRFDKFDLEGPTIIQTDSSYYAIMSHKTGYRPNNVVAFRANSLSGPWSQPYIIAPLNTRTFNSQSGFSLRIVGSKQTTYLYVGDQWDSNSLWESRYIWLPLTIDDSKKSLSLSWHDIYDLDVNTGEWKEVEGTWYGTDAATTKGGAWKQEAAFSPSGEILTGIYGNESTVTFTGIKGEGKKQWVSFYYQNTDDMGYGDQPGGTPDRIGGTWQLRRISWVRVNNGLSNPTSSSVPYPTTSPTSPTYPTNASSNAIESLYQRDTHKGIILSTPLSLFLKEGENMIEVGGLFNGFDVKGGDLVGVKVYPAEQ